LKENQIITAVLVFLFNSIGCYYLSFLMTLFLVFLFLKTQLFFLLDNSSIISCVLKEIQYFPSLKDEPFFYFFLLGLVFDGKYMKRVLYHEPAVPCSLSFLWPAHDSRFILGFYLVLTARLYLSFDK
jgi:hypothetical protein